jgi:hypothetical protein
MAPATSTPARSATVAAGRGGKQGWDRGGCERCVKVCIVWWQRQWRRRVVGALMRRVAQAAAAAGLQIE